MQSIIAAIVAVVFIGTLLLVLGAIVRFSFVSARRTRNSSSRLRTPDVAGLGQVGGLQPPTDLDPFYREERFVEKTEFYLVDPGSRARWFIEAFLPVTPRDTKEWRKVSGVAGIPIAIDQDKGVYYIAADGSVHLQSPNVVNRDVPVAPSIAALRTFVPSDDEEGG